MTLTEYTQADESQSPQALIPEARDIQRRRRRRRLLALAYVSLACGIAGAVIYLLTAGSAATTTAPNGQRGDGTGGATVVPKDPTAVAIGPNGVLYIADTGRQQILERLPDGRFGVAVGTGAAGDSGDGGRATHARIDLTSGEGDSLVVTPAGILYFDQVVGRAAGSSVRKVTPNGRISTVVGGHPDCQRTARGSNDVITRDVSAGALAVAPDGGLSMLAYTCANRFFPSLLVHLTPSGRLAISAHSSTIAAANGGQCSNGLVYSDGTTYVSCGYYRRHPDAFVIVKPDGHMNEVPAIPRIGATSAPRGLTAGPNGTVVGIDSYSVVQVTPHGVRLILHMRNASLGTFRGFNGRRHVPLFQPSGVAVDRHGEIFLAGTSGYSGPIGFTGIVEVHAGGHWQVLWRRRP